MTHNLKLRTFDEEETPDSFPFPRVFASSSAQVALLEEEEDALGEEPIDALDLASHIEDALDELQKRLDRVRDEIESVYRFPGPGEWPPHAA